MTPNIYLKATRARGPAPDWVAGRPWTIAVWQASDGRSARANGLPLNTSCMGGHRGPVHLAGSWKRRSAMTLTVEQIEPFANPSSLGKCGV